MGSRVVLTIFLTCLVTVAGAAEEPVQGLRFAKIFADHMVLQRDKPIKVWGWAEPGANVSVTLTQDAVTGEQAVAEAAEADAARGVRRRKPSPDDGRYHVTVRYVEQNVPVLTPQTVVVTTGGDGRWLVNFAPAEASFRPTWIFAKTGDQTITVRDALIGEIWLCAGQSNMGWSNFNRKGREAASADFPGLRYVAWHDSWYKPLDDVRANIRWQPCDPESARSFSAVPYLFGMFLHRYLKVPVGVVNVARGGTLGQAWCTRGELDAIDHVIMKTVLAEYDSETAMWDDPAQVERIMAEWENACAEATVEHEKKAAAAKEAGKKEPRLRLPRKPDDPRSGWSPPAGLFNATVMPIRDLAIRGVLYYQGENNNFSRWTRYEHTFPRVPVSFRKAFGDPSMPFGCISQPGFGEFGQDPEIATIAEGYAIVRDIQKRALADDPHADMIATYPTGNSYIHPAEKMPVAEYASLWALARVYKEPVVHRANRYESMKKKDDRVYLFFDIDPVVYDRWKHIEDNAYWQVVPCPREGKAAFQGFIIAGEDRRWYPAKAKHTKLDGTWCIEVWSDLVPDPVAVRYGWANWPTGNLVGRERLPVPTFRTDDWPIPEGMNYSKEAQERCSEKLKQLRAEGEKQALDRRIRQMLVDLPRLERELHLAGGGGMVPFVAAKIARMERALGELSQDRSLERELARHPGMAERIRGVADAVTALKSELETLESKE